MGAGVTLTTQKPLPQLTAYVSARFGLKRCVSSPVGDVEKYATDPAWKDLVLFYENYDGDTGLGCGAR